MWHVDATTKTLETNPSCRSHDNKILSTSQSESKNPSHLDLLTHTHSHTHSLAMAAGSVSEILHRGHLEQDKLQSLEVINQNSESWPQFSHLAFTFLNLWGGAYDKLSCPKHFLDCFKSTGCLLQDEVTAFNRNKRQKINVRRLILILWELASISQCMKYTE